MIGWEYKSLIGVTRIVILELQDKMIYGNLKVCLVLILPNWKLIFANFRYKERFISCLPPSRRANADFSRPVFTAVAFYLCAKRHKVWYCTSSILHSCILIPEISNESKDLATNFCTHFAAQGRQDKVGWAQWFFRIWVFKCKLLYFRVIVISLLNSCIYFFEIQ